MLAAAGSGMVAAVGSGMVAAAGSAMAAAKAAAEVEAADGLDWRQEAALEVLWVQAQAALPPMPPR